MNTRPDGCFRTSPAPIAYAAHWWSFSMLLGKVKLEVNKKILIIFAATSVRTKLYADVPNLLIISTGHSLELNLTYIHILICGALMYKRTYVRMYLRTYVHMHELTYIHLELVMWILIGSVETVFVLICLTLTPTCKPKQVQYNHIKVSKINTYIHRTG